MQNRNVYLKHLSILMSLSIGFMSLGAGGCKGIEGDQSPNPFTISFSPINVEIPPGGSGKCIVTMDRVAGYVDRVALKVVGQVSWARFTFVPETLGVGNPTSYLSIEVDSLAPLTSISLTIRGVSVRDTNQVGADYGTLRVVAIDVGWYPMVSGTSNNLFGVDVANTSSFSEAVGAVGDNGTFLRTVNSVPWGPIASGTTALLYTFRSDAGSSSAVAVGYNGTILSSTDFGVRWTPQVSGTSENLWSVSITNENVRTVVGGSGTILRTTNSGTTWSPQTSGTTRQLNGVSFVSSTLGVVVGNNGTILRTGDGGATWIVVTPPVVEVHLYDVAMVSPATAVAVGVGGFIVRSTNAGASWAPVSSGTTQALYRVSFADEDTGTCVGQNGTIIKTTNGGITWTPETIQLLQPPLPVLYGVSMVSGSDGFAVGSGGTILRRRSGQQREVNPIGHVIANSGNSVNQTRRNKR